ncbi:histidinol-phosphate transaminase [Chitinimonas viridis]|uniref:Putative 8-amino-7-oxononanoate synthase n=1 Tax=Chitinimonas viridis TaxID=664880 RepID=A0ABT8B3F9_9NEIS|nr:histidinol-phosphate transaminase [Chitinimonas viridis]MDN3576663.1 histidinol-phosphate transaminase [Chitinimonas viridis]
MVDLTKILKPGVHLTERRNFREKLATRKDYLRLDLNENLSELSPELFNDMMSTVQPGTFTAYPDLGPIYSRMATHVGVSEDQIVLTNGSDMGIKSIFDACIERGDHIVLHDPYFLMYERYAQFFEAELEAVPVCLDWRPDCEAMLSRVNERTKMVVVEEPSGNLGTGLTAEELEHMAAELARKNVLLVIDEAYMYCERQHSPHLPLLEKYGNVILVRTMSKAYGLAGARLGVLISSPAIARELYKVRSLYEISGITANVTEWHLNHPEVLAEYQATLREGKRYLEKECARLGINFKDTPANFVIMEVDPGQHTADYSARLKEKRILIGKPYSLPHLLGWARITVGTPAQCRQLVEAMEALILEREAA